LALYGAANAVATVLLIDLQRVIGRDRLAGLRPSSLPGWERWATVAVFVLCIPAGYVLGHDGPYVLLLLLIPGPVPGLLRRAGRPKRRRPAPS
jgi:hypothetical protein